MTAYYNENDPFAAAWLRGLISAGLIAAGDVDERSITEVKADEIRNYTQHHFFAGIGGWSYALRLAMWPDDRPVFTGSCPCQPFSSAGKQSRQSDERHLWPHWNGIIRELRPAKIFGEQVASAVAAGWWDDVAFDLEAQSYTCASAVLPACAVGAPHRRDRLWFVAHSESEQHAVAMRNGRDAVGAREAAPERREGAGQASGLGGILADADHERFDPQARAGFHDEEYHAEPRGAVGDAVDERLEGLAGHGDGEEGREGEGRPAPASGFWGGQSWIECADGKARAVESRIPLLAHGVRNRVGLLRGFGNAIVPQLAAEFIMASEEAIYGS